MKTESAYSESTAQNGHAAPGNSLREQIVALAQKAKCASGQMRSLSSKQKDDALHAMADALIEREAEIIEVNARDLEAGRERGLSEAMLDRLKLTPARIKAMAESCRQVAALPDPVGQVTGGQSLPNGLKIEQVRTPLGVIGIIYESRPNVTVEAAILCLKSGNATILRGGSEAFHSNTLLCEILNDAARNCGLPDGAIAMIGTTDRSATTEMAQLAGLIDLIVPRGGNALKKSLSAVATVPIIYAAGGVCHMFVDESAQVEDAVELVFNAKVQRPSTCNALETLLIHRNCAVQVLAPICERLQSAGVDLRGDQSTRAIVEMSAATDTDWDTEYNDLVLSIAIVDDLESALQHIENHGTGHSEAIVTRDYANAEIFLNRVDAAAVYANASTRFTDGFEFGLGAEIGISTQKLHARGPLGLEALTTNKYVVRGRKSSTLMNPKAKNKIVLVGFMGSGKSCVGQILAWRLNLPFHDLDALIERAIEASIADYFAQHGESAFRAVESEILQSALKNEGVLSTGGGVVTQSQNRNLLHASNPTVVYLRATARTLAQRIREQPGTRPLIDGQGALDLEQTTERVSELLNQRAQWYEECADLIVDCDEIDAQLVADEIVAQISRSNSRN